MDAVTSIPSTATQYQNTQTTSPTGQTIYSSGVSGNTGSNTAPTPINVSSLQTPPAPLNVPTPPAPSNYAAPVQGGAATIQSNGASITPTVSSPSDIVTQLKSLFPAPVSSSDLYANALNNSPVTADQNKANADKQSVLDAQGKLSGINAQLEGLKAESTGANLQLANSAGGQAPSFLINGQQAQSDRNYAIKAIPLQVQALTAQADVASAQGNASLSAQILQQAQDHLDKVFSLQQTDANNTLTYQTNLIDKAFTLATTQQQQQLTDLKTQIATNHSDFTNAWNEAQTYTQTAIANGQGQIASQIAAIPAPDINSKTFAKDLQTYNTKVAGLAAQIKPKAPAATVEQTNAAQLKIASSALADAQSAIKQGADPNAVRQAYLVKYPSQAALWDTYFTPATGDNAPSGSTKGTPTYTAPATSKPFNLFDPSTW